MATFTITDAKNELHLSSKMCVYVITHVSSGKQYVGQTVGRASTRWSSHRCATSGGGRSAIRSALLKHGHESFTFKVVALAKGCDELNGLEVAWVAKLHSLAPGGYNLESGGARHHTVTLMKHLRGWLKTVYRRTYGYVEG